MFTVICTGYNSSLLYFRGNLSFDTKCPGQEVIVKDGKACLLREDFWSLGLNNSMETTVSIFMLLHPFYQPM